MLNQNQVPFSMACQLFEKGWFNRWERKKGEKNLTPNSLQISDLIRRIGQIFRNVPVAETNENPTCSCKKHDDRGSH